MCDASWGALELRPSSRPHLTVRSEFAFMLMGVAFLLVTLASRSVPVSAGDRSPFGDRRHSNGSALATNLGFACVGLLFAGRTIDLLLRGGALRRTHVRNDCLELSINQPLDLGEITISSQEAIVADVTLLEGRRAGSIELRVTPESELHQSSIAQPTVLRQQIGRGHRQSALIRASRLAPGRYHITVTLEPGADPNSMWRIVVGSSPSLLRMIRTFNPYAAAN